MCAAPLDLTDRINTLTPQQCFRVNGHKAHRICKECWFKPETGFGLEGRSHKCPGCLKLVK